MDGDGGTGPDPAVRAVRIDHVGVAVPDPEAVADLLARLFGLEVEHRERNEEQGVAEVVLRAGAAAPDATVVQLVAPLWEGSPVGRFLDRRGPGLHHLALTVGDVDAAVSELHRRGVRVLTDGPRPGTAGSRITFIHPQDAGGVLVELVEPGPGPGGAGAPRPPGDSLPPRDD
ncbi:MAG: methylmalonyl-CoA epimerase [Kineosporiaceae bacterium]